jgi:hypothetical protein
MTSAGPQPTAPDALRAAIEQNIAAVNPGYTANLPGTLVEDVLSTDMGVAVTVDLGRVDYINSVSPYAASPYVLALIGAQLGVPQGLPTNTSVNVVFSGPVGYVVPSGFMVSDGTYQYVLQSAVVIGSSGQSSPGYCVAKQSGTWAVLAGSVTQVVTSVPAGYTITCTNPDSGTPGGLAQSVPSYRAQLMQEQQATGSGLPSFLRAQLQKVAGVNPRLVSILQVAQGWEIICGGGDPYAVAGAILSGVLDLSSLIGSDTTTRNIIVSVIDGANSYNITFVNPPMQTVTGSATWNTILPNFTASAQVNQAAAPALAAYLNSIQVGAPINLLQMAAIFRDATASALPNVSLTSLSFEILINGTVVTPATGTDYIASDPESYFYCAPGGITAAQG